MTAFVLKAAEKIGPGMDTSSVDVAATLPSPLAMSFDPQEHFNPRMVSYIEAERPSLPSPPESLGDSQEALLIYPPELFNPLHTPGHMEDQTPMLLESQGLQPDSIQVKMA